MTFDAFDPRGWLCHDEPSQSFVRSGAEVSSFAEPVAAPIAAFVPCEAPHGAGERASARRRPGGLDKKGNRNSVDGETTAQRARRLRKVAAKWMRGVPLTVTRKGTVKRKDHAVVTCGSYAGFGLEVAGQKGVMIRKGRHGAFFGQAVTCGSVSACPSCAGKIARLRCEQISHAVQAHHEAGGCVGMLTLTHGHRLGDALKPQLEAMQKRWQKLKYGNAWKYFCKRVGLKGGVTSREVTDGAHGWHPHLHILLFFAPGTSTAQVFEALQWLQQKWLALCVESGFSVSERAQDFRLADTGKDAGEYLTKHGVEWEMTHSHMKRAKGGGRSPWQMLDEAAPRDRARFIEYATAFHGAKMLTWFGDVQVDDQPDEAAVHSEDAKADDVAILPDDTFRRVVEIGAEDAVLRAAEKGGFIAVLEVLGFLRCGGCYLPKDGQRLGTRNQYPPGWNDQWKGF